MSTHYACRCGWTGDAPAMHVSREVEDNMHDRHLVHIECEVLTCPKCGADDIDYYIPCSRCHEARPVEGADECAQCLDFLALEESQLVAEFADINDASDFFRAKGRGYTVTAGTHLTYAVRKLQTERVSR